MSEIGKAHIQVIPVFDGFADMLRKMADAIEGRPCAECARREAEETVIRLRERTEHYRGAGNE